MNNESFETQYSPLGSVYDFGLGGGVYILGLPRARSSSPLFGTSGGGQIGQVQSSPPCSCSGKGPILLFSESPVCGVHFSFLAPLSNYYIIRQCQSGRFNAFRHL